MAVALSNNIVIFFNELLTEVVRAQQPFEFTLPQLHERFERFAQQHQLMTQASLEDLEYKAFRKALFHSPLNEEMKKRGGEIVILENKGKVDESVYCLKFSTL
jgi:hypothetical protein